MKAAIFEKYGNPREILSIKEIEKPTPKSNEILIKVQATTVNRTDDGMVTAKYFVSRFFTGLFKPKNTTSGTDFAGIVEEAGNAVKKFKVGDRIFGFNDQIIGSHAEYLCISEDEAIAQIPDTIDFETAAASIEGAHYAINFINKVGFAQGQHAMVYGATGAIGSAAVQILKHYGLIVTAVCNTANVNKIKELGADTVVDYTKEDYTNTTQRFSFVFDAVGKSSFNKCKSILVPNGFYISSELGAYGSNIWLSLFTPLFGGKKVKFPMPGAIQDSLHLIQKLLESGKFKPLIDRTYPLQEIVDAYEYVASGQKVGNVVINIKE
jgi:NADPH:quinone reductase-like Zn-dependent oxidoreductase